MNAAVDNMPKVGFIPNSVNKFNQTSFTKHNQGSMLARSSSVGTKPILKSSSSQLANNKRNARVVSQERQENKLFKPSPKPMGKSARVMPPVARNTLTATKK